MGWPRRWTKPVYRRRHRNLTGTFSPLTPRKLSGSYQVGPVTVTATGRVYVFGARIR